MQQKPRKRFSLSSRVLFFIGLLDILRGFMHTFLLTWSATNIAKLDMLNSPKDQLFLLGVFGISNFLTGFIYLIISKKAPELSPYILIIIPLVYLFGLLGIRLNNVHAQAAFEGRYFMFGYFALCIITFILFLIKKQSIIRV